MTDAPPAVTVVTATYDRAAELPDLLAAVLAQEGAPPFEMVVVDDGSTDGTRAFANDTEDPRVRWIHQPNRGPGPARNAGAAIAQGAWLVFLDDDDRPDPDWLATLATGFADDVALVSCGCRVVDHGGRGLSTVMPSPSGLLGGFTITESAGAVAVRRGLFHDVGGYLAGLRLSENTDLLLRATIVATRRSLRVVAIEHAPLRVRWRPRDERASLSAAVTYDAARWLRVRYPAEFAARPSDDLNYLRIALVAAARLGRWPEARRYAAASLARSRSPMDLARLLAASAPPIGRRVWPPDQDGDELRLRSIALPVDVTAGLPPADRWFLPWGYEEGTVAEDDPRAAHPWSTTELDRWTASHAGSVRSGDFLVDVLAGSDPRSTLRDLRDRAAESGTPAVVAELDRDSLAEPALGPPTDRGVRRRWSADGLALLAEAEGFSIERRASVAATATSRLGRLRRRGPRWTVLVLRPT